MKQNCVALLRTHNSIYNSGFPLADRVFPQNYEVPYARIHKNNGCNEKRVNIHNWMNKHDTHLFAVRRNNLHTIANWDMGLVDFQGAYMYD